MAGPSRLRVHDNCASPDFTDDHGFKKTQTADDADFAEFGFQPRSESSANRRADSKSRRTFEFYSCPVQLKIGVIREIHGKPLQFNL